MSRYTISKGNIAALITLITGAVCWGLAANVEWIETWPQNLTIATNHWISIAVEGSLGVIKPIGRMITQLLTYPMDGVQFTLLNTPWIATMGIFAAIAWKIGGIKMTMMVVIGLGFIVASGYWNESMNTLALVTISVPFALVIGGGVGIIAHEFNNTKKIIMPTLDVMQTIPTFAYLTPLLIFFGFGPVVGLIASVIYASPPMARNVILGLERVDPEIREAALMAGGNRIQRLVFVQIPSAMTQIMVGVNQCIMASLSMVIIAAVIGGFNDIGWEVLLTMRKAQFGPALLAGLVIVVFAVLLDRLSGALANERPKYDNKIFWGIVVGAIVLAVALRPIMPESAELALFNGVSEGVDNALGTFTAENGKILETIKNNALFYVLLPMRIGLDDAVLEFTWGFQWEKWMGLVMFAVAFVLAGLLAIKKKTIGASIVIIATGILQIGVAQLPWGFVIIGTAALGWAIGGRGLAIMIVAFLSFILISGMWERAMLSVYLCGAAVIACAIIGGSIGLVCAISNNTWKAIRPICDVLQTIPLFVFLIPVLMFFQIGEFSAFLAIIAYAIVPMIRYTQHGLTTTPDELIEAAVASGATKTQIMINVRMPFAAPTMMLGLNQTILFAFAMLVITALIGTTGLGQSIYLALGQADVGLGIASGAAMALLAIIADRLVQAVAQKQREALGLQ